MLKLGHSFKHSVCYSSPALFVTSAAVSLERTLRARCDESESALFRRDHLQRLFRLPVCLGSARRADGLASSRKIAGAAQRAPIGPRVASRVSECQSKRRGRLVGQSTSAALRSAEVLAADRKAEKGIPKAFYSTRIPTKPRSLRRQDDRRRSFRRLRFGFIGAPCVPSFGLLSLQLT